MADDRCAMCRDAGFPNVLAHYKPIPAGQAYDGKAVPALCFDHKHGKAPKFIVAVKDQEIADRANAGQEEGEPEGKCGCGRALIHKGRCSFRRQNGSGAEKQARPSRTLRTQIPRNGKPDKLIDALQNIRGFLNAAKEKIDHDLAAVDAVIEIVRRADESESADEFMQRGRPA